MEDLVPVVTCVSTTWPTGDKVVETHSEVSVPTLERVSIGFMHRLFCPVLTHCPRGQTKRSLASQPGALCVSDRPLSSLSLAHLICKSVVPKRSSSPSDIIGHQHQVTCHPCCIIPIQPALAHMSAQYPEQHETQRKP